MENVKLDQFNNKVFAELNTLALDIFSLVTIESENLNIGAHFELEVRELSGNALAQVALAQTQKKILLIRAHIKQEDLHESCRDAFLTILKWYEVLSRYKSADELADIRKLLSDLTVLIRAYIYFNYEAVPVATGELYSLCSVFGDIIFNNVDPENMPTQSFSANTAEAVIFLRKCREILSRYPNTSES